MAATIDAGDYAVSVAPGLIDRAAELVRIVAPAHKYAIITDSNVAPLHAERLVGQFMDDPRNVELFTIPAGEANKTRRTWAELSDRLLAAQFGRDSTVIALGGGVVCDIAGFVAATFMRGVPVVHIPTTLLAMIDASIGGKTGVDTPHGKNLVGAYHQPRAVIVDPELLDTLPAEELRSGFAEVIKHGAICDAGYFDFVADSGRMVASGEPAARDTATLLRVIETSIRIKVGVVGSDEREAGARKSLNFGHTIGHAIEMLSNYSMRHGEAVAAGMVLEAEAAELEGITEAGTADRLRAALTSVGLPVTRPAGPAAGAVLDAMRSDKKGRSGAIEYAVPSRIGVMAGADSGYSVRLADSTVAGVLA